MKGDQVVHTCSNGHAIKVATNGTQYLGSMPSPGPKPTGADEYCTGGTVMWPGFHFSYDACTTVLFEAIRISSRAGLALAVVVTMALGVLVDGIGYFRRRMMQAARERVLAKKEKDSSRPLLAGGSSSSGGVTTLTFGPPPPPPAYPLQVRLLNSLLFGLSLAVSYVLMLLAMTYNGSLFLAVVAGLAIGHFLFSETNKITVQKLGEDETLDPCCSS